MIREVCEATASQTLSRALTRVLETPPKEAAISALHPGSEGVHALEEKVREFQESHGVHWREQRAA